MSRFAAKTAGRMESVSKRFAERFTLKIEVPVTIGNSHRVIAGTVINLSSTGCCLRVPVGVNRLHVSRDTRMVIHFILAGDPIKTHVRVMWVRSNFGHVEVGAKFDNSGDLKDRLTKILGTLVANNAAGAIRVGNDNQDICVVGALSGFMGREMFRCFNTVRPRRLVLRECVAVDSAGVALVSILRDRGVEVVGCGSQIKGLMTIVMGCPPVCGGKCS